MIDRNSSNIIIEVGANSGSHTEHFANLPDTFVYALEPSPVLYLDLVNKFRDRKNVLILPFAADLKNGTAEFNVSEAGDKGVGSLFDYNKDFLAGPIGQHPVFVAGFAYKQLVATIRMDTLMSIFGIERVDYLHIDAQGNDFAVLQSFGDKLWRVKEGICECTYKNPLYVAADLLNNYEDCMKYLDLHGFSAEIEYIHENETEVDISFKRRIATWKW